ncbi:MAG: SOS response-associated peptidase [Actinomycetota bacterium]|nr:SOS response-associated peptidase [Actinomycetota bacterium]MDH4352969.1 SOS response-associated peptidase [Actinomycetota bacterium]MDH5278365.1 SOS response-associated peptidase [Actinomycetota bacterium]
MCGRYAAARDPDALVEEFEVDEQVLDKPLEPDWNVAPTKQVYVVMEPRPKAAPDDFVVTRQLRVAKWGLVPSWAKDPAIGSRMINARVETVADKPSYRRAFAARRCILPADGFYEWYAPEGDDVPRTKSGKPRKQPFYIHPSDGSSLAMAGLYEWWRDKERDPADPEAWLMTTTVITTSATDELGRIHDRMPLVVDRAHLDTWLQPSQADPRLLTELLSPASAGVLDAYPVSLAVNDVRHNGPELVDPLPADAVPEGP